jgi:hypothetical protein
MGSEAGAITIHRSYTDHYLYARPADCEFEADRTRNDPARESFHEDKVSEATRKRLMLPFEDYDPPHLGVPTLIVDISREYSPDFDSIVSFANG